MVTIHIPDKLARRLERIAREANRSIDDVAASILEEHMPEIPPPAEADDDEPPPGSLAALIKAADEADIYGEDPGVADRSREILDTEFAAYLRRRIEQSDEQEKQANVRPPRFPPLSSEALRLPGTAALSRATSTIVIRTGC